MAMLFLAQAEDLAIGGVRRRSQPAPVWRGSSSA
jgi:hypothetical protein